MNDNIIYILIKITINSQNYLKINKEKNEDE